MKTITAKIGFALLMSLICLQLFACGKEDEISHSNNSENNIDSSNMKITIGSAVFTATLNDNPTVTEFKKMLPLTINMSELNGNEKFYYFSSTLPTNAAAGGSIQAGDLMLYGNNCLMVFYENFQTSYSYTRIGRIVNTSGLVAALGSGNITIKYELE